MEKMNSIEKQRVEIDIAQCLFNKKLIGSPATPGVENPVSIQSDGTILVNPGSGNTKRVARKTGKLITFQECVKEAILINEEELILIPK